MSFQDVWFAYNIGKTLLKKKNPSPDPPTSDTAYRPQTWDGLPVDDEKQLMFIKTNIGGFFFDAILRVEHTTTLKSTEHPVQTGANIVDHAYVEPAIIVMEIGMSDAMASMVKNQFTVGDSRSVSAYRTLLELQRSRLPFRVHTRLNLYENMLIEEISAADDAKTQHSGRFTVTLKEIFVVEVSTTTVSAREHSTGQTNRGVQQAEDLPTLGAIIDPRGST
ncbi:MAG: hypothetical protein K0R78_3451 [Pelosinus sp.]|nr:hypothetical protein [Pelosinus sp.]